MTSNSLRLPGREKMLADDLSHNRLSAFLSKVRSPDPQPTALPRNSRNCSWTQPAGHHLVGRDRYCNRGLADSTRRTYQSDLNRYLSFCYMFGVSAPFPVSEALLCYFVTSLAREGVAPSTVRTYLAGKPSARQRLPVTPALLRQMRPPALQNPATASYQEKMHWAAATVCFFVFSARATVPTPSAFDAAVHLAWGDVAIADKGGALRVFLKRSKTDQYGRGTEVFRESSSRSPGFGTGEPSSARRAEPHSRRPELVWAALTRAGVPIVGYSGHSFRIGAAAQAGIPDSTIQALGRPCIPGLHPHPQGTAGPELMIGH